MDLKEIRSILIILTFLAMVTTLIVNSTILWFIVILLFVSLLFIGLRINKIKEDEKLKKPSSKDKAKQLNTGDDKKTITAIKIILIAITCVVLLFAIYTVVLSPPQSKEYANNIYHFSIVYPHNWQVMEGYAGVVVAVALVGQNNIPSATCIVMIKAVPPNQRDIHLYTEALKGVYNITSENYSTINGEEAYDYSMTQASESGLLISQNRIFLKNGNAYLVGCASKQEVFNNYKSDFDSIISSFKFIG
jgi:hypothetical protein